MITPYLDKLTDDAKQDLGDIENVLVPLLLDIDKALKNLDDRLTALEP